MAEASIVVAVRVRPFSGKEAALLAPAESHIPFLGDGGLGGSPSKFVVPTLGGSAAPAYAGPVIPGSIGAPASVAAPGSSTTSTSASAAGAPTAGPSSGPAAVRTKYLRNIVQPVDDKVLIFDPPDANPLSRLMTGGSGSGANTFAHGARKPRDIRYAFDRVFPDHSSQEEVFENTTKPLLDGVMNGFNASVFAYGVSRSRRSF